MRSDREFSLWLPFFSLWSWMVFVAWPIVAFYLRLLQASGLRGGARVGRISVPRSEFIHTAVGYGARHASRFIYGLHFPAVSIELLISLTKSWPEMLRPAGMSLDVWRALTYPVYCLPFWWFAGMGLEGLLRVRVLRWYALLPGTILSVALVVMFLGFTFGLDASDKAESDMSWVFGGIAFWAILFAAFPVSWIRNRRFKVVK